MRYTLPEATLEFYIEHPGNKVYSAEQIQRWIYRKGIKIVNEDSNT